MQICVKSPGASASVRRGCTTSLLAILLVGSPGVDGRGPQAQPPDPPSQARSPILVNDFVGNDLLASLQANAASHPGSGVQINRCSISSAMENLVKQKNILFCNYLPASPEILHRMGGFPDTSETYIRGQADRMRSLGGALGSRRVWWNVMPEYDQSGGPWAVNRSLDYSSRDSALSSWKRYYLTRFPLLASILAQPQGQRQIGLVALNAFSFSTHYSYALGADLCILERSNDEIGDIQTGIAFVRGAGRQYNRPWGIEISNWRSATDSPTQFDEHDRLTGGWSPGYIRRHFYIAFMSGADMILNEAMVYSTGNKLNPLGNVIGEVANFFLVKHPNIGTPAVSIALMLDARHGFEPKYGRHMQGNFVWYSGIPYSRGDFMIHNFLNLIFPGYWRSGTLPPEAPHTPARYRLALAQGEDPRPWEPMGASRWGDQFDVILSDASSEALAKYRAILLVGDVTITPLMKQRLSSWVAGGGTLVLNAVHTLAADSEFTGVQLTARERLATASRWIFDPADSSEPVYRYRVGRLHGAWSLAKHFRDPLITSHRIGSGEVILTLPGYLQGEAKGRLLSLATKLVNTIVRRFEVARVEGTFPIEYIVNRDSLRTIATLVNNTGTPWEGIVTMDAPPIPCLTREWITDSLSVHAVEGGRVTVTAWVPPYDVRIYAAEKQVPRFSREGL